MKATIKKNQDVIFAKKPAQNQNLQQIKTLKTDVALFSRLFIASQSRSADIDDFFRYENQGIPPALSLNGELRSGHKAEFLKLLADKFPNSCFTETPISKCHIIDGAALVNIYRPVASMSFQEYANNMIIRRLEFLLESSSRIDLVFDVYLDTSLKNTARSHRGSGSRRRVLPHLPVPKEWNSFLRNSDNKTELFAFLATHIHQNFHPAGKFVFVTNDSGVLCWPKDQDVSLMAPCNHEEADSRIFVHAYDASSRQDMNDITVHTVDTDVVVLAITFCGKHPDMELKVAVGSSVRLRYYNARVIQSIIGTDRALSLLFFYSLTGFFYSP